MFLMCPPVVQADDGSMTHNVNVVTFGSTLRIIRNIMHSTARPALQLFAHAWWDMTSSLEKHLSRCLLSCLAHPCLLPIYPTLTLTIQLLPICERCSCTRCLPRSCGRHDSRRINKAYCGAAVWCTCIHVLSPQAQTSPREPRISARM
jgi:hypothetical protein